MFVWIVRHHYPVNDPTNKKWGSPVYCHDVHCGVRCTEKTQLADLFGLGTLWAHRRSRTMSLIVVQDASGSNLIGNDNVPIYLTITNGPEVVVQLSIIFENSQ